MRRIGVRELRQRASEYLRSVEAGESFEVTARGRPVALLVPVPERSAVDRLAAAGRLGPAEGDLLGLGEPLAPRPGAPLPSEQLERSRREER